MAMTDEDWDALAENERDVGKMRRHMRELLGEKKQLQGRVRELEAAQSTAKPDQPEWFSPEAKEFAMKNVHRLGGLEGDARSAELAKLTAEMAPLINAHNRAPYEGTLKQLREEYVRIRGDVEANTLAAKLAVKGSASALAPFIRERIQVEKSGEDDWSVTYRDATGATVTPDVLEFEFRNNPAMAPLFPGNTARDREVHDRKVAETLGRTGAVKR